MSTLNPNNSKNSELSRSSDPNSWSYLGLNYTEDLVFQSSGIKTKVQKKCKKMKLSLKQNWLGAYFTKEIRGHIYPEFAIRKVNEFIGLGVFAEKKILANTYIGEYSGLVRPRKFWESKANSYLFEYYLGELFLSTYIIDAKNYGNHTRFINHSDENPNLEPIAVIVDGTLRIIFYSKRTIAKGEQLLYDYGTGYWNSRLKLTINTK